MAVHARTRLLENVKKILVTLPTSGSSVYEDPASAVQDDQLPAIVIEPISEDIDALAESMSEEGGYSQRRVLSVLVTAIATSASERDTMSVEIEESLMNGSIGRGSRLVNAEFSASAEGQHRVWMVGLTFDFQYLTNSKYPRIELR